MIAQTGTIPCYSFFSIGVLKLSTTLCDLWGADNFVDELISAFIRTAKDFLELHCVTFGVQFRR